MAVRPNRYQQSEDRLALAKLEPRSLFDEPCAPMGGCALVLLTLAGSEKARQLECLGEANELELRGGLERLGDVVAFERTWEGSYTEP